MKVLLVYSPECTDAYLARGEKVLRSFFGSDANFSYAFDSEPRNTFAEEFRYTRNLAMQGYDALVFTERGLAAEAEQVYARLNRDTYVLENTCSLRPLHEVHLSEEDLETAHVFNRLAPRKGRDFYYTPFGYLYRHISMGKTNEFGHRIDHDLKSLRERDEHHLLVAVFGGSGAASFYCLFEEMFSELLQAKLNASLPDKKVTVLNFAQPGAIVLNEINHYLLFCQTLNPEIVIAHDGFNDLAFGVMSDRRLLEEYEITYQGNFELWAQMLHDTPEVETVYDSTEARIVNFPQHILRAYLNRKVQFERLVTACGSRFIWGLQPFIQSKHSLTGTEHQYLISVAYRHQMAPVYRKMEFLYEKLLQDIEKLSPSPFIDFHQIFSEFGKLDEIFIDFMHTTPKGEEKIAGEYEKAIIRILEQSGA